MQTNGVLSEQDMMQDMLSEEKTLLSNYGTFIPRPPARSCGRC